MAQGKSGEGRILATMKEIVSYVEKSETIVRRWIANDNFPAAFIDGRWESHTALVDEWRKARLLRLCPECVQQVG